MRAESPAWHRGLPRTNRGRTRADGSRVHWHCVNVAFYGSPRKQEVHQASRLTRWLALLSFGGSANWLFTSIWILRYFYLYNYTLVMICGSLGEVFERDSIQSAPRL